VDSRPADSHQAVKREAEVVAVEHVTGIVPIGRAASGEAAQHVAAHLLGNGRDGVRCQ
jgi:hypothetical protein